MATDPSTTSSRSSTDDWRPDPETLAAIDRWLQYRVWHSRVPGAQVAIGIRGEVLFSEAYGWAELESRTAMSTRHLFRIASHSKTFTATVVLQLVEQGRLTLETPIGDHIAELADDPTYATLTVRELLEHTAGLLRDGRDSDYWDAARDFPERAELISLVTAGTKGEPGELFAYSNLGYSLLGLVISDVTGLSYAEATRTMIIEPLGLQDTASEYIESRAEEYAAGYTGLTVGPSRRLLPHVDTHAMASATGFTSTASDLVGYFAAHAFGDNRLITDRSKRLQQRKLNAGDPDQPEGSGYGLGMSHDRIDDHLVVGHSGGYPGHITNTTLDPSTGLVVSVLTNATDGPAGLLGTGVLKLLDRARSKAAEVAAGQQTAASEAALAHTGRFANGWGVTDLMALGGVLHAISPSGWDPVAGADVLTEQEPDRWLISEGPGYGSVNEPVVFDEHGGVRFGGGSLRPMPSLPERSDVFS